MNTWTEDYEAVISKLIDLELDCPRCEGRGDCQQCRILPGVAEVLRAHLKSIEQMEPIPEPADPMLPTQPTRSAGKVAGHISNSKY